MPWMRCVFTHVHVQLQTRSPHLRNGCTDCAEILFAVSGAYSQKLGTFPLPIQEITAHVFVRAHPYWYIPLERLGRF